MSNYETPNPLRLFLQNVKKLTLGGKTTMRGKNERARSIGRSKTFRESTFTKEEVLGKQIVFGDGKIPGLVGLRNHGNTCYMNSVIQCLSNTELLTQYFITDQYKADIRGKSKQNAKKYGTKGELTNNLARLLKSLWTQNYSPSISSDLKAIVNKYGPQYRGAMQHDAQEFLLWLLDKIHEDLNIAAKKKYRTKSVTGRPDELAAAEALANHTRCNFSYIHDIFQALFKSSLTCPKCHQQSNTFDPFLCVSLPIPQENNKPLFVTVVYHDAHPKQVRIGLLMDCSDTIRNLREALSCDTNIPQQQLVLTEIYYDGFHRTFHDDQPLTDLRESDNIYAIEVPPASGADDDAKSAESTTTTASGDAQASVTLVLLNKLKSPTQEKRFGGPFVVVASREATMADLQQQILANMTSYLQENALQKAADESTLFSLKVLQQHTVKSSQTVLPADVELPLYTEAVDKALQVCTAAKGPDHVKIIVEWHEEARSRLVQSTSEQVEEHLSVKQVKQHSKQPVSASLDDCLASYTKEERKCCEWIGRGVGVSVYQPRGLDLKLECDTAWFCPNCRSQQYGTTKSISLWSLPDVLIVHLKRFKQSASYRSKLETLIKFPLHELDMSRHMSRRRALALEQTTQQKDNWSPWRPNKRPFCAEADYVYDLHGVVNHYGNLHGGHYIAFCKSAATGSWYSFDDQKVSPLLESDVVSPAAYLLFYQRRAALQGCTPHDPQHWLHRVARISFASPAAGVDGEAGEQGTPRHSQSHEYLVDEIQPSEEIVRNSNPYATMRGPRTYAPRPSASELYSSMMSGSPSVGSLGNSHVTGSPGNSHVTGSPDNSHVTESPDNSHVTGSPSNSHVTGSRGDSHGIGMPSDSHVTGSMDHSQVTKNISNKHVTGSFVNAYSSKSANISSPKHGSLPPPAAQRPMVDLYLDQKIMREKKRKECTAAAAEPSKGSPSYGNMNGHSAAHGSHTSPTEVKTGILVDIDSPTESYSLPEANVSLTPVGRRRRKSSSKSAHDVSSPSSSNKPFVHLEKGGINRSTDLGASNGVKENGFHSPPQQRVRAGRDRDGTRHRNSDSESSARSHRTHRSSTSEKASDQGSVSQRGSNANNSGNQTLRNHHYSGGSSQHANDSQNSLGGYTSSSQECMRGASFEHSFRGEEPPNRKGPAAYTRIHVEDGTMGVVTRDVSWIGAGDEASRVVNRERASTDTTLSDNLVNERLAVMLDASSTSLPHTRVARPKAYVSKIPPTISNAVDRQKDKESMEHSRPVYLQESCV